MLQKMKKLSPRLSYLRPSCTMNPSYLCFSDASQGKTSSGKAGYFSGIFMFAAEIRIYHVLDGLSSKQSRVLFSSIGSEIIAAAHSKDKASYMAGRIQMFLGSCLSIPLIFTMISNHLLHHNNPSWKLKLPPLPYHCWVDRLVWNSRNLNDPMNPRNL